MRKISCVTFTLLLACFSAIAQTPDGKTAEQMYTNITALKGTPGDQLLPAMQFMAASLGVNCEFCHVTGKMDADDKGAKKTAREMIAMQNEINKTAFHGQRDVTCVTCHRGAARPVSVPAVLESDAAPKPPAPMAAPAGAAPAADAILEKFVTAVGGADALRKASTRVMTGKILSGGSESPVEVTTKAPNKRVTVTRMGGTSSYTAFDGATGWMGNAGRPAREMSAAESAASGLDAEFALGLRLKELYPQLRRGRPEDVNGAMCEVLNGTAPGKPVVRLYFVQDSGLLVRMVRYAESPLGRNPTQIDYADYRDAGGVRVPYRWTLSRPNGRFTIQIDEVKANVPVDDAKFVKPSGDVK
ncbi:MAG TPA: c-type cytochrome [Candidatus Acidoferrum sp.]|nr:c-type cytochrome [Candidatus Acidoferrum sp.]